MNNQLLTKIIKYSNKSCPDFVYDNPLLNPNVARDLSKSFVKILTSSKHNSQTNENLRFCILENIRTLCNFQPEEHVKLNDNAFDTLIELYNEQKPTSNKTQDCSEQKLDTFLIRNLSDCQILSEFNTSQRPELVQALINLNSKDTVIKEPDIIHWDCTSNKKWNNVLKNIWNTSENCSEQVLNDACLKMKPEIEKQILEELYRFIISDNIDVNEYLESNKVFIDLAQKCSKSKECFRICICIFNHVFIATNFNSKLEQFIPLFIKLVKVNVSEEKLPLLYPENLQCLVILMNLSLETFLNDDFVFKNETLSHLNILEVHHKPDVVMLLSHNPQWMELYLEFKGLDL